MDAAFHLIPPHSRSCCKGIEGPPPAEEQQYVKSAEESDPEEELHQYPLFGDVPLLTYPIQSTTGASSSAHPPI